MTSSPTPLVTVLIDTYNHEAFIEHAISSVLDQGLGAEEMEVIVVDDGSTDRTPELVRAFAPRVRHLYKPNGGQASAFNVGIPEARGRYVALLDGDDWWASNKLTTVLDVLEDSPDVAAVGHGIIESYTDGRQRKIVPQGPVMLNLHEPDIGTCFNALKCLLGTSRFTARKELLTRLLPVPDDLIVEADEYLFTLAAAHAPIRVLPQPLTFYRLHGGNLYQFAAHDAVRLERKHDVLACLVRDLPPKLTALGVPDDTITTLVDPNRWQTERIRLALFGKRPTEVFRFVKAALHRRRPRLRPSDYLTLAATLAMPPSWYFNAQRRLSRSRMKRGASAETRHHVVTINLPCA